MPGPWPPSPRLAADLTTSKTGAPQSPEAPHMGQQTGPRAGGVGRQGWPGKAGCVQGNGTERGRPAGLSPTGHDLHWGTAARALGADGSGFG